MTEQTRPQLTDALIERMLTERAGPGAPADLVGAIATAVESTGQRASGLFGIVSARLTSRPRRAPGTLTSKRMIQVPAVAVAVVVVAIGAGLFLRLSPAVIVGPSGTPSVTPTPSASVTPSPSPTPSGTPAVVRPTGGMFAFIQVVARPPECAKSWGGCPSRVSVANIDGTGAHELFPGGTGNQSDPAWSPDGTRLLYSEAGKLYMTDASGSAPQLVDTGCVAPCSSDSGGSFSNDGTRLVFIRTVLVPPASTSPIPGTGGKVPGDRTASVLATIDLSTGRVEELASTTILDCPLLPGQRLPGVANCGGFQDHGPRWSPDGTQIVFTQDVPFDINGSFAASSPPPTLFVVDADGGNLRKIGLPAQIADWSPDGTRIAFGSVSYAGSWPSFRQYYDVYTIRPDGTDLRRLTSDRISHLPMAAPSWTAGGRIWFIRVPMVNGDASTIKPEQFWIMDADGSNATQLSVSAQLQAAFMSRLVSWPTQP